MDAAAWLVTNYRHSVLTTLKYAFACTDMCAVLHSFIPRTDSYTHHHNQDWETVQSSKQNPLEAAILHCTHSLCHWSLLRVRTFTLRMLFFEMTWYIIFGDPHLFTKYNALLVHPTGCAYQWFSPPYYRGIFHSASVPELTNHSSIKECWVVSTILLLWIKVLWTFTYRFWCEYEF